MVAAATTGTMVVASLVGLGLSGFIGAQSASAVGTPGVPADPQVVYWEDFENRPDNTVQLLDSYTGASGMTYTADPSWITYRGCNGFVLDATSPFTGQVTSCEPSAFRDLGGLAAALSSYSGHGSSVLAAFTAGDPGGPKIQFKTATPIALQSANRFLTFSVDAAATSCHAGHPLLRFAVSSGGVEHALSTEPIDPCKTQDPRTALLAPGVYGGTYAADGSFLSTGSDFDVIMRNYQASGVGNDGAIDNIRVLDVTPQLDKAFSPTRVPTGGTSTLTLTVTNTSELSAKSGWSFTDALPSGLTVANPANVGGTCDATTVATAGATSVVVTDGQLASGDVSCTVTVDVTSTTPSGSEPSPKVYTNDASNFTTLVGLNPPGPAQVEFFSTPRLSITKTSSMTENSRVGDTVSYSITATNVGNADYTAAKPAVILDDLTRVLDGATYNADATSTAPGSIAYTEPVLSWSGALAVGATVTLNYSATLIAGGDGTVRNVAWEPKDPTVTVPPACDPVVDGIDSASGEPCAVVSADLPRLSIEKTADVSSVSATGETVRYTVVVKNEGPGDFSGDAPAQFSDDLTAVLDDATYNNDVDSSTGSASYSPPTLSWRGALASGESATVTYSVTYTGAGNRMLTNTACVPSRDALPGAPRCSTVEVPGAGLTAWKEVAADSTPVAAGSVLTYTLHFVNDGQAPAAVDHVDFLTHVLDDAELTTEPTSSELTVNRVGERISVTGTVAAGASATVTYQVTVRPDGERGDNVAANFLRPNDPVNPPEVPTDPTCQPENVDAPTCTATPIGQLLTGKSVSSSATPVQEGTVLTYTLSFQNQGQGPAAINHTDVLADVLDDADVVMAPVASSNALDISAISDAAFTVTGTLAPGATATVTYAVAVKPQDQRGDHVATNFLVPAGATPPAECTATDQNCTTTPLPRISATKSADPASGTIVRTDQVVTYVLTFTNTGNGVGTIDYTDDLAGVLDDATLTGAPHVSGALITATDGQDEAVRVTGTLAAGETATVTYAVTVNPESQRGDNLLRNLVARTGTSDPQCDDADVSCTEHPMGNLVTWKSVEPGPGAKVHAGSTVRYTLHFRNAGTAPVAVDHADVLTSVLDDADVTVAPSTSGELTVSAIADGRFSIVGELRAGDAATVTYDVVVKADGSRGDSRLDNFLVPAGVTPPATCEADGDDLPQCTVTYVVPPAPHAGPTPPTSLPLTGADVPMGVSVAGVMLLLSGLVVLVARRRRGSAMR